MKESTDPPRRSCELTVVGSINADVVVRCDRLPAAGETVLGTTAMTAQGGKGANQAVAAARAGAAVAIVGCVGDDEAGREALAALRRVEVNVDRVRTGVGESGKAYVFVAAAGENQIVVVPGANTELVAADVRAAACRNVLCQLEIGDAVVEAAGDVADRFFLNASPARPLSSRVRDQAELIIVNSSEAEAIPGLLERGRVVVTRGKRGAELYEDGQLRLQVEAPAATVIDTTGAGDAFAGTLVVSILAGEPIAAAIAGACATATRAVSELGPRGRS